MLNDVALRKEKLVYFEITGHIKFEVALSFVERGKLESIFALFISDNKFGIEQLVLFLSLEFKEYVKSKIAITFKKRISGFPRGITSSSIFGFLSFKIRKNFRNKAIYRIIDEVISEFENYHYHMNIRKHKLHCLNIKCDEASSHMLMLALPFYKLNN